MIDRTTALGAVVLLGLLTRLRAALGAALIAEFSPLLVDQPPLVAVTKTWQAVRQAAGGGREGSVR